MTNQQSRWVQRKRRGYIFIYSATYVKQRAWPPYSRYNRQPSQDASPGSSSPQRENRSTPSTREISPRRGETVAREKVADTRESGGNKCSTGTRGSARENSISIEGAVLGCWANMLRVMNFRKIKSSLVRFHELEGPK